MKFNYYVMPSREEINDACLQGKAAVVASFERTEGQLAVRVMAFTEWRAPISTNCVQTPSSQGLKEPAPRNLYEPGGEKSGVPLVPMFAVPTATEMTTFLK